MNAVRTEDTDPGATATVPPARPAPRPATAETGFVLRLAHVRATEQIAAGMPAGLVLRYHEVLAALTEFGPHSQQQLAQRLGINRTIMVSLIDAMEQAGLVERNRDPADRRSYALAPTAKGTSALADMERAADHANAKLNAPLTDREQRQLERLLRTIASADDGFAQRPAALTRRTIDLLSQAHHCVSQSFAQRLKEVGLTPPLYGVLRTLDASGPTSQQAIAEQLGLSGTAILQTVDRLEADQLVRRRRNPTDRRSYALELTPHGRTTLSKVTTALDALSTELDSTLGDPRRQQQLRRLLLKLLAPDDHG
jgi:DNA-binding MarR family transcriptional regulator